MGRSAGKLTIPAAAPTCALSIFLEAWQIFSAAVGWNGSNLWRSLIRPPFDLISPDILVRFKYALPILGISICLIELGYPVFIWIRKTRLFWLVCILAIHATIGLAMGMYLFALVMIVLNLAAFGIGM